MCLLKKSLIKKSVLLSFLLFFLFSGAALAGAKLEIGLPGMSKGTEVANPAVYLRNIFIISYSLIGFLAVAIIVWGGILYSIPGKTSQAKQMILGALSGIVLLFSSYLILYTIDPTLTELLPENIQNLEPINIKEPPGPPDAPFEGDSAPFSPSPSLAKIYYKDPAKLGEANYLYQDLTTGGVPAKLLAVLNDLSIQEEISITITETTRNHGCFDGDPCVKGAICGTSAHCAGLAVDLRATDAKKIMEFLKLDNCTNDLFYSGFPDLCLNDGLPTTSSSCAAHIDHIHYSIKPACRYLQ